MCGIAGIMQTSCSRPAEESVADVERMIDAIRHRGPDDDGIWADHTDGVVLGHCRLAVIDLSNSGRQPMRSSNNRYVISYNGEIYNYLEMRKELEDIDKDIHWRGTSGTEVLLAAIEVWGIDKAVRKANGMFAFGLWDRKHKALTLARDRLGKKPLYYGFFDWCFAFASELKTFKTLPYVATQVDRGAISMLLRYNYIPSPYSIFEGIYKLNPSCMLNVSLRSNIAPGEFSPHPRDSSPSTSRPYFFWSAKDVIEKGEKHPPIESETDALWELDDLLRDAVTKRMISDVPLGAFLSGGIDSSIVVALMQTLSNDRIKTFTIGYHEKGNEAQYAKAVAEYLDTDHVELYVDPGDVLRWIPDLSNLTDEPHGDTAIIPTYLVSRLAKESVTVCLSGDGGDEMFSGYPRYLWAYCKWFLRIKPYIKLNEKVRYVLSKLLMSNPTHVTDTINQFLLPMLPKRLQFENVGAKLQNLGNLMALSTPERVYHDRVFHCNNPGHVILDCIEPATLITDESQYAKVSDPIQRMVYLDLVSRLPDSIVSKVDRTSMKVSLESRAPLLDYRLVEFSARLHTSLKIRDQQGKWILRQLLYKYVPEKLVNRPKAGFKMPIVTWLKGPLIEWASDLLSVERLKSDGYFDYTEVHRRWREFLNDKGAWHYHIWDILMFQAWLRNC